MAGSPARSRWWRPQRGGAGWIAASYLALGLAWIAFSDRLVFALVSDPALQERISTAKGVLYVLVTAALLFALIRRSERGLRALGRELRATVDGLADGVLVVDGARRVVEANRALVALLGVASKADLLGPVADFAARFHPRRGDGGAIPAEDLAAVRVLSGGDPVAEWSGVLRRADGADVHVSVVASRIERHGAPPIAVKVIRDVTAAHRLDAAREDFLATAAHELKTPLAVIKAYAQLVARREPVERRALEVIDRQVDRMNRLVEQLLEASRLRAQEGGPAPERFDLAALARDVAERLRPSARGHDLQVVAEGPVPVVADRARIDRVLASLVDNAIRYSPAGGPVRVHVLLAGTEAHVAVEDRGLGIPEDRQPQVFERWYRAHAGTPEDYGGLGLGLETSRALVERHGGRMWFESQPGAGSTFHFGLPASREDA